MPAAKTTSKKHWFDGVQYYIAAFFMPSILLFDLYNRNRVENHIVFTHVLIVASVLAVIGVLLFWVIKIISASTEGALLLSTVFWICFWLYELMLRIATRFISALSSTIFMIILGACFVILAVVIRKTAPPFNKIHAVFNVLAICIVVLFVFNLYPGVRHELVLRNARAEMELAEEGSFYMKRNFLVDPTLPTPNIYWLHVDGMMSLETVERFWGVPQEHVREELAKRGFLIYEDALLNAGFTDASLTALLSPAFYDSFFGERLAQVEMELRTPSAAFLVDEMAQVGLTYADNIVPYYELLVALIARGYDVTIRGTSTRMPQSFEHLTGEYNYVMSTWHRFLSGTGDLPRLLSLTTPLSIPQTLERVAVHVRQTGYGESYEPLPRFDWRPLLYTHMAHVWEHDPAIEDVDPTAVHVYPLAYELMVERMLYYVDRAIEENPNAIIVLQSDHGFHSINTQNYLLDQGHSLEQVVELINSVFSAVRIPPEYGGLETPIAPLNISRELVNRFVGENYTLLP